MAGENAGVHEGPVEVPLVPATAVVPPAVVVPPVGVVVPPLTGVPPVWVVPPAADVPPAGVPPVPGRVSEDPQLAAEAARADIISGKIEVHDYMADNKCPN